MLLLRIVAAPGTSIPPNAADARLPDEGGTLVRTVLWSTLLSTRSSEPSTSSPPELAGASPPTLVEAASLSLIVVPVIVAFAPGQSVIRIPPPTAACISSGNVFGTAVDASQALSSMTLSSIVSVPSSLIPPPSANLPFGALTAERLPVTKLRRSVTTPTLLFQIPPPRASVASPPLVGVEPATLSSMRVCVTVSVPQFAIPPPLANEHGLPQIGCGGPAVTLLPLMTLSEIVTVAPMVLSAAAGINTPPPAAKNPEPNCDSGFESLKPPVIVTRLIETVRSAVPSPIVITGPPPSMVVAPADLPTRLTLLSIVIPPANVPGASLIVSPSCAASIAAWSVAKHPGFGPPTQRSAASAGCGPTLTARRPTAAQMPVQYLCPIVEPPLSLRQGRTGRWGRSYDGRPAPASGLPLHFACGASGLSPISGTP